MSKSFFHTITEKKGIYKEIIKVEWEDNFFYISVADMVGLVESYPESEQLEIQNTISKINFFNGDLLHYFTFLALSFIKSSQNWSGEINE